MSAWKSIKHKGEQQMPRLAPSILSADFSALADSVSKIEAGGADLVHCDVMDGHFVPNITFGAPIVKSLVGKTSLPLDVHLMIERPDERIPDFVTPQTEFIVVHQEACVHLHRTVQLIHSFGIKAGVALNPATPLGALDYILDDLDLVLIMSVNPGFGGQKFIPVAMEKIAQLSEMREESGLNFAIEVDGGVNLDNAMSLIANGADILVAGSAVFGAEDVTARTREFTKLIHF